MALTNHPTKLVERLDATAGDGTCSVADRSVLVVVVAAGVSNEVVGRIGSVQRTVSRCQNIARPGCATEGSGHWAGFEEEREQRTRSRLEGAKGSAGKRRPSPS